MKFCSPISSRLVAFLCAPMVVSMAQTIQFGNTVAGAIECGASRTWTFRASAGDKVVAHVTEQGDAGGICPTPFGNVAACAFDQCVEIRDEADELIGMACSALESNACGNTTRSQLGPLTIPRDGNYRAVVRDANNIGRGAFALSIQRISNPLGADQLVPGAARIVPVQVQGEFRTFSIAAEEGETIGIDAKPEPASSVAPRLALYGPSGDLLALPESGQLQHRASSPGRYTLLTFDAVAQRGSYSVRLSKDASSLNQVIPQVADGGGWQTVLVLLNQGREPAPYGLRFYGDTGAVWTLPADKPLQGTIPAGGSQIISSAGTSARVAQGWGELASPRNVSLVGFFRWLNGQEAAVHAPPSVKRFLLAFDNSQGTVTSMAIANSSSSQPAELSIVLRNEAGSTIAEESMTLPARGHLAFAISDRFAASQNARGVLEVTSTGPGVTALGLRFVAGGIFSTVPVAPLTN